MRTRYINPAMKPSKKISTDRHGQRVISYYLDGQLEASIVRRTSKRRYDVVYADKSIMPVRSFRSRSQAEIQIFI